MIAMLPAVRFADWLRAGCAPLPDRDELAAPWCGAQGKGHWFSRSAWSLRIVARWKKTLAPAETVRVWVPDFFCEQSLGGLREDGVELVFYPITAGYAPDWAACGELAGRGPPGVFVLVHYFGLAGPAREALDFSRRHGAVCVEDCAHCLLPGAGIGQTGDFALFSPHKLLALPDGAVLVALPTAAHHTNKDAAALRTSLQAVVDQTGVGEGRPIRPIRWVLRRAAGGLGWLRYFRRRGAARVFAPLRGETKPGLPWTPAPAELSLRLLARSLPHLEADGATRVANAAQLKAGLALPDTIRPVAPLPGAGYPFLLGLVAEDAVAAATLRARLHVARAPATTWPDIPPEVAERPAQHGTALRLWQNTVYAPVHQRLAAAGWLARTGRRQPSPVSEPIELCWDASRGEWDETYARVPRSTLLQARVYATAKEKTAGWRARYALLRSAGRTVATLAVLQRGGPGRCGVTRINRGPCWVDEATDPALRRAAFAIIAREHRLAQGRLLFIAPNDDFSDQALADLAALGYRRRRAQPWHSAWIDLRRPEAELSAALDGKWRNQMNSARRSGLQVETSRESAAIAWLVARHDEMKAQRGIGGPESALLLALAGACGPGEDVVVLRASQGGEPVAGVLLVRHGTSATYLVGWNSLEGRRRNAGNLLLWQGLLELRQGGCQWLDLCGLDERRTPGITSFKRGLNGTEYRLAGEYWSA